MRSINEYILKLDNMQYDVSSDNPLVDPAELAAIEAKKVAMRRPQTSNKNQGLKILPGSSILTKQYSAIKTFFNR